MGGGACYRILREGFTIQLLLIQLWWGWVAYKDTVRHGMLIQQSMYVGGAG